MSTLTVRCPHCNKLNRIPTERVTEAPNCGVCKAPLLSGRSIEGTDENLAQLIASGKPVVLDFWAPWCGPCQSFAPIFEATAGSRKDVIFVKINTEEQQNLAAQYHIRSIPTIMAFNDGKLVQQINGALPQNEFNGWLSQTL